MLINLNLFHRTPLYMAPEVMDEALYDERADLWSLGCIIYEAHYGQPPIKTTMPKKTINNFSQLLIWLRNPQILWPSAISDDLKSLLRGLLQKDPKTRLKWQQIVEHPYVKDNLVILDNDQTERPLTQDLTTSQQIRKEKQRDEIIFNRGQKMIANAMSKCKQANSKIQQKPPQDVCQHLKRKPSNVIGDNESISSDDSVNAIIQTDLETDVEGPLIKKENKQLTVTKPVVHTENQNHNENLVIKRYTDNFAEAAADRENKDNANLKIGTMLENLETMQLEDESKQCSNANTNLPVSHQSTSMPIEGETSDNACNSEQTASNHQLKNTDSVKRKLTNNLNNFSIRLGNDITNPEKACDEYDKDDSKEKAQCNSAIPMSPEMSDNRQDAPEDDQSPPIENEEWLAFIRLSMKEVLNGETDSLKHQNVVRYSVFCFC